jgi:hypothetical protein
MGKLLAIVYTRAWLASGIVLHPLAVPFGPESFGSWLSPAFYNRRTAVIRLTSIRDLLNATLTGGITTQRWCFRVL